MDNRSEERGIDKVKDCVMRAIDRGIQNAKSICPPREEWTWERLWTFGTPKDEKKSSKMHQDTEGLRNRCENNAQEGDNGWNVNYCFIKMQDPCAPCCCDSDSGEPSTCPDGLRTQRRRPICGCESPDSRRADACCDACRMGLQSA